MIPNSIRRRVLVFLLEEPILYEPFIVIGFPRLTRRLTSFIGIELLTPFSLFLLQFYDIDSIKRSLSHCLPSIPRSNSYPWIGYWNCIHCPYWFLNPFLDRPRLSSYAGLSSI